MKNNKFYLLVVLVLTLITFNSCGDLLDETEPIDAVGPEAIDTLDDLESVLLGSYSSAPGRSLVALSARFTNNAVVGSTNQGQGIQIHEWTFVASEGRYEGLWNAFYFVIGRANLVISLQNQIPINNDAEQERLDQLIGEAYALRAHAHLSLVEIFAGNFSTGGVGVPVITTPQSAGDRPSRSAITDVYTSVDEDLLMAASLIPATQVDKTRMTLNAVRAMQVKSAFNQEEWGTAITIANQVLTAEPIVNAGTYPSIWNDTGENGVIFKLGKDINNNNGNGNGSGNIRGVFDIPSGTIQYGPSSDIMGIYDANDIRASLFFGDLNGEDVVTKYPGSADGQFVNDAKIYRSAEILLMRAEAHARMTNLPDASSDYNLLRNNRITGVTNVTFGSMAQAIDNIHEERRREMAYEGKYLFDLKRLELPVDRAAADCTGSTPCTLPANDNRFIGPIPQREIDTNDNLVQNPGY